MGSLLRRLLFLFRRHQFERELEEELRFHEDMKARALADAGNLSEDEARTAARRRVGNPLRLRERSRDAWTFVTLETVAQDARHALRLMRRNPAFTATALATIALGIGLNTAIFSVAYGVLWRPLPYPDADRLVLVASAQLSERGVRTFSTWPHAAYDGLRTHATAFDDLAAYSPVSVRMTGRGEPLQVPAAHVSRNFLATLGVAPDRGRAFLPRANASDDAATVIVSDRLWRTTLRGDAAVVGQVITVDGQPRTIIGVLPPNVEFRPVTPMGALPAVDILLPDDRTGGADDLGSVFVLGRLKQGMSRERAEAELTALANDPSIAPAGGLAAEGTRAADVPTRARVTGLQEYAAAPIRTLLLVLLGAVSVVLVIACVNVANLQMARLTARRAELSVRAALGADRRRIARQLLTEAVVLSIAGALLGMVLAHLAIRFTLPLVPQAVLPRLGDVTIDARVMAFCFGLSLVSTLLVGLVPALRVGRVTPGEGLGLSIATRTTGDHQGERLRTLLVAAQVALTLMLLISAGLLIRSFVRLTSVSPGFDAAGEAGVVQTVRVTLPDDLYDSPERIHAFARGVLERIRYLPGVDSASLVNSVPFALMFIQGDFEIEGQPKPDANVGIPKVEAGYFRTMGIPLLAGREFDDRDTADAPKVAIVSEKVARDFFPGGAAEAIGRRVRVWGNDEWLTIVGVVADIRQRELASGVQPMIYAPFQQDGTSLISHVSFVARTTTPSRVADGIRAEIRRAAPDVPIEASTTLDEAVASSVAAPRFRTVVLALFATSALLIATCGIYGLMAYSVSQRRREIGMRMALGADRRDVIRLVLGRALRIVAAGAAAGLFGSLIATRVLRRFLFEVTPTDPIVFATVTLLLMAVGVMAAWLPARRATRIDPFTALRAE